MIVKMDLDDRILHYILVIGGITVGGILQYLGSLLGADIIAWVKKKISISKIKGTHRFRRKLL